MDIVSKINSTVERISEEIDRLSRERKEYEKTLTQLKDENADLKHRMQVIRSEMEEYLGELRKIREYYASSHNNT